MRMEEMRRVYYEEIKREEAQKRAETIQDQDYISNEKKRNYLNRKINIFLILCAIFIVWFLLDFKL